MNRLKNQSTYPYILSTDIFDDKGMISLSPKERISQHSTIPQTAYEIVNNEVLYNTPGTISLSTFSQGINDEYILNLITDTYTGLPDTATSIIAQRCINILANLWNTPENKSNKSGIPVATSLEASMLAGDAALSKWHEQRKSSKKNSDHPNIVVSAGNFEAWSEFSELRKIGLRHSSVSAIQPKAEDIIALCNENTICIVGTAGHPYTGLNDDVASLDKIVGQFNSTHNLRIPIHVDASIGGYVIPFLSPDTKWDFRLKNVFSIQASADKFGMIPSALSWLVWKEESPLQQNGEKIPGNTWCDSNLLSPQILIQYYQFIRRGFDGYRAALHNCMEIAHYAHMRINSLPQFVCYGNKPENPIFSWTINPGYGKLYSWRLSDLREVLNRRGWDIEVCKPVRKNGIEAMRMIIGCSITAEIIDRFIKDMETAVSYLESLTKI